MAAPLHTRTWTLPGRLGRDLDRIGRSLVRQIGGPWSWDPDLKRHDAWRVKEGVRLELHLEAAQGASLARLRAMPAGYAARGCLPSVFGLLTVPSAVLGLVFSRFFLVLAVAFALLAGGSFFAARRASPRDEAETARQFTEASAEIDAMLLDPPQTVSNQNI